MVSSQKDRVMILGGKESDRANSGSGDKACQVVEEIDFLKRNIVNLAPLKIARANTSAFLVNDSIYVFGGNSQISQH